MNVAEKLGVRLIPLNVFMPCERCGVCAVWEHRTISRVLGQMVVHHHTYCNAHTGDEPEPSSA